MILMTVTYTSHINSYSVRTLRHWILIEILPILISKQTKQKCFSVSKCFCNLIGNIFYLYYFENTFYYQVFTNKNNVHLFKLEGRKIRYCGC